MAGAAGAAAEAAVAAVADAADVLGDLGVAGTSCQLTCTWLMLCSVFCFRVSDSVSWAWGSRLIL